MVISNVIFQTLICTDPQHMHNSPIQHMLAFDANDHHVEITMDGEMYDVRIDRDEVLLGVDASQLDDFLEKRLQ